MAIRENRFIDDGTPLGGELFTFFRVGKNSNGIYDWGALPNSPVLNTKSKMKPFMYTDDAVVKDSANNVYGKFTQLSDDMKRAINYGHNFKEYTNALEAIRGVAAGDNFLYNVPTSWARPADFWGYDHEQPDWFSFSTRVSSLSIGGTTFVNHENLSDIFTFGRLAGLTANSVNFGFLMWNNAFSATQPQVYFYSCTNMAKANEQLSTLMSGDNGLQIVANSNNNGLGQGTWRMYPVVTTASFTKDSFNYIREETANGKWYPFPYSNLHILNIVGSGEGDDDLIGGIEVSLDACDIRLLDAASLTYKLHSLSVMFSNSSSSSYEVSYEWSIRDAFNQTNSPQSKAGKVVVPADDSVTVEIFSVKNEEDAYRFSVPMTPVELNIAYWMETDGGTQENMITIELESK